MGEHTDGGAEDTVAGAPASISDEDLNPFAELEQTTKRRPRSVWKRIRHLMVVTHRWTSIVLTLWVVVISLTGAWLVFNQRFDAWLHAERYEQHDGDVGPTAAIDVVEERVADEGGSVDYLAFPDNGRGVYQLNVFLPGPTEAESDDRFLLYYVDPGTGEINGSKDLEEGFTPWVYRGHEYMWQDNGIAGMFDPESGWCRRDAGGAEPGGPKGVVCDIAPDGLDLIAWFGVALGFLIVSGFYLWYWPNVRRWATALTLKRGKGRFQFHLSLHKVSGLLVSVPLLVVTVTGFAFAFPNLKAWYENATPAERDGTLWEPPEDLVSSDADGRDPLSADEALAVIHERFPDRTVMALNGQPFDETATWQIWSDKGHSNWTREGFGGNALTAVDQYSGEVLYDGTAEDGNVFDQTWTDLQFPLHAGDFGGQYSRAVWFVVGLSPLLLAVTGLVMWWIRSRRVRAIAARSRASA